MPANLPPNYHVVEARYRAATDPAEKLTALQELWVLLPKHKGTEKMQAELKAKMSALRKTPGSRAGGARKPECAVERGGAGQFWLVGPPQGGRSALLRALTQAEPEVSEGLFTTRLPVPGMGRFEDVALQLVEAPAIYPNMTPKWIGPNLRISDGLVLVFGLGYDEVLEGVEEVRGTLERAKIALYRPGDEPPDPDDPGVEPLPGVVVLNQADLDPGGELVELVRGELPWDLPVLATSVTTGAGLPELLRLLYESLGVMRVYAKPPGKPPDMDAPFVVPVGATVLELTERIHKELAARFQFARLWRGERYTGGRVSGDFALEDRDVLEIHA